MGESSGRDHLAALRQFDAIWGELHTLVFKCARAKRVTEDDEDQYGELLGQAQVLRGRVSAVLGVPVMEQLGRQFDAFQFVLAQPSLSDILGGAHPTFEFWDQLWALAASAIRQAIGRLEAQTASGTKPTPEQYIPPRSQFDAYVLLKDTLEEAAGSLVVVDPYVGDSTLKPLLAVRPAVSIRLLTVKPPKDFAHALERFRQQWGGNIEAREGTKELHDRFLLVDDRVFFSGASFKDLGQRGSMIDEIRTEAMKQAVKKDIEAWWAAAQPIA
jgi:hypothetical protein